MNLVADESIERQIVDRLRQDGHDVFYIADLDAGIPDQQVMKLANERFAVLLTGDKDFGDLIFRDQIRSVSGIVLIRLAGLSAIRKSEIVSEVFSKYSGELTNRVTVVTPSRIRFRPNDG